MITGPVLLLDQHDAERAGELSRDTRAGNARADDQDVGRNRFAQGYCLRSRWG